MEKKLSPIAQSIKDKKELLKNYESSKLGGEQYSDHWLECEAKIELLEKLIEADQKLLEVERDQIIEAYERGLKNGIGDHDYNPEGAGWYNEKYGTYGN